MRRYTVEAAVRPAGVVEREVLCQSRLGLRDTVVGVQIDLIVLDTAPEALDKDVVPPAALAVHTDLHAVILEQLREVGAGELAALVGVKDLRHSIAVNGHIHGIHAEIRRKGVGHPPRQHLSGIPIHDGHQIEEPPAHRNVGDVSYPNLVRPVDGEIPEQIGVDVAPGGFLAGIGFPVEGLDARLGHEPADAIPAGPNALRSQQIMQHASTGEGKL